MRLIYYTIWTLSYICSIIMNKCWHRRARGGYKIIIGIDVSQGETEDSIQDSKQNSKQDSTQNDKQDRKIRIFAMSLACTFLSLALIVFHIMVSMRVIEYGNEVLYDKNDDYNSNDFTGMVTKHDGNDDQCLPIIYVVFSYFPTFALILVLLLGLILIVKFHNSNNADESLALGLFLQVSLGVFLVYLGFYFLPYMLLAFINDPIKTTFIYIMGASFILCICLLTYSLCFSINLSLEFLSKKKMPRALMLIPLTWQLIIFYQIRHPYLMGSGASIAYF